MRPHYLARGYQEWHVKQADKQIILQKNTAEEPEIFRGHCPSPAIILFKFLCKSFHSCIVYNSLIIVALYALLQDLFHIQLIQGDLTGTIKRLMPYIGE